MSKGFDIPSNKHLGNSPDLGKHQRMNYDADIAHCEGTECAIRDRCRRYQLHLIREQLQPIYIYSYTAPMYKNGECELFYKMK